MEATASKQRSIISERKLYNNSVTVFENPVPVCNSWHCISCTFMPSTRSCFSQSSLKWFSKKVLWCKVPENNALVIEKCPQKQQTNTNKNKKKLCRRFSRCEMMVTFSIWPDERDCASASSDQESSFRCLLVASVSLL